MSEFEVPDESIDPAEVVPTDNSTGAPVGEAPGEELEAESDADDQPAM